jgi:hypothetical protein
MKITLKILMMFSFWLVSGSQVYARKSVPDLTEVLKGHGFSIDFGFALMGFFALSLATISFAKGYEILTRASKKDELEILKEENEKLVRSNSDSHQEAEDQKRQIQRITEIFREKVSQEEILKKNAADLKKECEKMLHEKKKLLLENEALVLEMNQKSFFDMQLAKAQGTMKEQVPEAKKEINSASPGEKLKKQKKTIKSKAKKNKPGKKGRGK